MSVVLSVAAAAVAALFAVSLGRQYARRRRGHALAWTIALCLFAAASAATAVGIGLGWRPAVYAVFWLAGALVTVPFLAAGQLMLLDPARSVLYWTMAGLAAVWAVAAIGLSPMDAGALAEASDAATIPAGDDVFGSSLATALLTPFNWAALIVVGGVLWSAVTTRRWGILLLGVGVMVAGGSFAFVRAGVPAGFSATLAAGVTLMYGGFRAAARPPARGHKSAANPA